MFREALWASNRVREAFPDFYANFDFDGWVRFPEIMGFLQVEPASCSILIQPNRGCLGCVAYAQHPLKEGETHARDREKECDNPRHHTRHL